MTGGRPALPTAGRAAAAALLLLGLFLLPAPLLPPHGLAERVERWLGLGSGGAYLVVAIALQLACYGAFGILAAQAAPSATSPRARLLQAAALPLVVVGAAFLVRSLRLGRVPMLANAGVPIVACVAGVVLGLVLRHRSWKGAVAAAAVALLLAMAGWRSRGSDLGREAEAALVRLTAASDRSPADDARFVRLLEAALAAEPARPLESSEPSSLVRHHRAALLAIGIALGHEKVARLAGLELDPGQIQDAIAARKGTTLRGRPDWARHFSLSAALAVVGHPLVSDAGGLIKEELDALTHGTGFSFGDLAADRAGVRFAVAATDSEESARALRDLLESGIETDDLFPAVADLPEDLTVERFRELYDGVGSRRYREQLEAIEARLDACRTLAKP